jgi:hypothetical protein
MKRLETNLHANGGLNNLNITYLHTYLSTLEDDYFPKTRIIDQEAREITCHRCKYSWPSISAATHLTVQCPNCSTTVTVRPKRVFGPRTESPVGIYSGGALGVVQTPTSTPTHIAEETRIIPRTASVKRSPDDKRSPRRELTSGLKRLFAEQKKKAEEFNKRWEQEQSQKSKKGTKKNVKSKSKSK